MAEAAVAKGVVMTPEQFLEHWQGHRRLTRRVIEAFPEDQLFTYSIGSMRPFGEIARELLTMAEPMVRGVVTGEWTYPDLKGVSDRAEILRLWDESTEKMNALWKDVPIDSFQETITAFGQYTGPTYDLLLYVIDNEIHHRGQGYTYLRSLGVEPPPFWER